MRTEKVEKEDRNVSIILSSKQGESRDVHSHWRHRRVSGSYGPEYLQRSRTGGQSAHGNNHNMTSERD